MDVWVAGAVPEGYGELVLNEEVEKYGLSLVFHDASHGHPILVLAEGWQEVGQLSGGGIGHVEEGDGGGA